MIETVSEDLKQIMLNNITIYIIHSLSALPDDVKSSFMSEKLIRLRIFNNMISSLPNINKSQASYDIDVCDKYCRLMGISNNLYEISLRKNNSDYLIFITNVLFNIIKCHDNKINWHEYDSIVDNIIETDLAGICINLDDDTKIAKQCCKIIYDINMKLVK